MDEKRAQAVHLFFEFHPEDESITCNHRYLTKNTQAHIFTYILAAICNEERTYFEYREFKRNRALFPDPKATNFEVRFRRLMALINKKIPELRFEPSAPGCFHVKLKDVNTRITFETKVAYPVSEMAGGRKQDVHAW